MASLLRQIVAGPRARHPETDLDLSYITDHIIATSGPSQTYPQRAYRNPLDHLVSFLDEKHGDHWAIWEFRAEGTGYPDEAVHGRVRHYPWPDHHPPPFRLVPMILASMRNWLHGGEVEGETPLKGTHGATSTVDVSKDAAKTEDIKDIKDKRVVVVHCKAGKGRSGTMSCSYLISEEGWTVEDALARFTARRMRPQFGAGVSIPSQLRWIGYVDRWTKAGKKYIDRPIEILEIHVWGLRNGVKVDVEGFEDEGKMIKSLHTFNRDERVVVEGDAPDGGNFTDMMWDLAGYGSKDSEETDTDAESKDSKEKHKDKDGKDSKSESGHKGLLKKRPTQLIKKASATSARKVGQLKSMTFEPNASTDDSEQSEAEPGGMAVILKPKEPIRIPNSDVNISVERRNRTHKSMGLTMVTAVGHVWFNAFFDGNGPEQENKPSKNGVFSIEWGAMDGIKGTSRKGSRALDRMSVVWRVAGEGTESPIGEEVDEPAEGKPVPQTKAADWKGDVTLDTNVQKSLGLRLQTPASANVSQGSSVKSADAVMAPTNKLKGEAGDRSDKKEDKDNSGEDDDKESLAGVRSSGPRGEELYKGGNGDEAVKKEEFKADTADGTTKAGTTEVVDTHK